MSNKEIHQLKTTNDKKDEEIKNLKQETDDNFYMICNRLENYSENIAKETAKQNNKKAPIVEVPAPVPLTTNENVPVSKYFRKHLNPPIRNIEIMATADLDVDYRDSFVIN